MGTCGSYKKNKRYDNFIAKEENSTKCFTSESIVSIKFLKEIGAGGTSKVYQGIINEKHVAIKIDKNYEHQKEFEREISTLKKLNHNNFIISLIGTM
jgi:predicted Ser/Thr protein kinase